MRLPKGYCYSGIVSGIKASGKKDLALIVSEVPARAAAVLTTNRVKAAPLVVCQERQKRGLGQAVIINSGNANAGTGPQGLRDAREMVRQVSQALHIPPSLVWVASTGKIGEFLPMNLVKKGITQAAQRLSPSRYKEAATAILTTDRGPKISLRQGGVGKIKYSLLGMAKGAGMIMPQMTLTGHATLLCFLQTDLAIASSTLKGLLKSCVDRTFNVISVDGDTSTNDMVLILANGRAGNISFKKNSPLYRQFEKKLLEVCHELALMMVRDGEGATKVVRLEVKGARNHTEAQKIVRTVGNSLLVKTAFFGGDPNWGRLVAAAGRAGVPFHPHKLDLFYDQVLLVQKGVLKNSMAERRAKKIAKKNSFGVILDLHAGPGRAILYSSDLGHNYVQLNSKYRT